MSAVTESRHTSGQSLATGPKILPLPLTPAEISEQIESLRGKYTDPSSRLTKEMVLVISAELQALYKNLVMGDLDSAIQRQLENFMWTDCFKTPLMYFMKADRTLFQWMIEAGVGFYLGFIQDIGIHFDVQFIKNSVRNLYCTTPKMYQTWWKTPPKSAVYYVIQNSMVHIGDLLRYRGSFVEALRMYEKSTSICPGNGHPYNQMGLVQLHIDSKSIDSLLSGIYYYVRAISVANTFVPAQDNLASLLSKVKDVVPRTHEEEFVHSFLLTIGQLDSLSLPTSSLTSYLATIVVKKSLTFHHVFRLLVIALWVWKREVDKRQGRDEPTNEENNAIDINVSLLNGLVEGLMEFHDLSTARYMPHLKICIDWLRLHGSVTKSDTFLANLNVSKLCRLVNRLVPTEGSYTEVAKDLAHVILPEEKKLLGFLPLANAYEHLQSPFDEMDPRLYSLRTGRLLQGLDVLADTKPHFIERNVLTKEYKPVAKPPVTPILRSGLPPPSRRNVALQSIFNQIATPPTPLPPTRLEFTPENDVSPPESQGGSGSSVKSTIGDGRRSRQSPTSYYFQGQSNPPTPNPELFSAPIDPAARGQGVNDTVVAAPTGDYGSLFTSIWTPFHEKTINTGGWK